MKQSQKTKKSVPALFFSYDLRVLRHYIYLKSQANGTHFSGTEGGKIERRIERDQGKGNLRGREEGNYSVGFVAVKKLFLDHPQQLSS